MNFTTPLELCDEAGDDIGASHAHRRLGTIRTTGIELTLRMTARKKFERRLNSDEPTYTTQEVDRNAQEAEL